MTDFLMMSLFLSVNVFCAYKIFEATAKEQQKNKAKFDRLMSQLNTPLEPVIKMVQNEMIIETKDIAEPQTSYEVWLPETKFRIVKIEADNEIEALARAQLGEGEHLNTVPFNSFFEPRVTRITQRVPCIDEEDVA